MGGLLRSCLQSTLKLLNSILTMVGLAMVLYSSWSLVSWYSSGQNESNGVLSTSRPLLQVLTPSPTTVSYDQTEHPWFLYAVLLLGIVLCLISCSGHIAADSFNDQCLTCYMFFVCFLVIVEVGFTAEVFFNKNWERDFPEDPTGQFDQLKIFVKKNFEICKWAGLSILLLQVSSLTFAFILRVLGPDPRLDFDSDEDYLPSRIDLRQPFINQHRRQHADGLQQPQFSRMHIWSSKWKENVSR